MSSRRPSGIEFEESDTDGHLMEQAFERLQPPPEEAKPPPPAPLAPAKPVRSKRVPVTNRPDDEIDLHGMTREEAIHAVQNFILSSHRAGFRQVLIITGRGRRSGGQGPVLKQSVEQWLQRNGKPYLRDFGEAPGEWGGSGALWVFLKN